MTDLDHSRTQAASKESSPKRDYEPPKLTLIGPLEKITLGSTGKKGDSSGMMKK